MEPRCGDTFQGFFSRRGDLQSVARFTSAEKKLQQNELAVSNLAALLLNENSHPATPHGDRDYPVELVAPTGPHQPPKKTLNQASDEFSRFGLECSPTTIETLYPLQVSSRGGLSRAREKERRVKGVGAQYRDVSSASCL